VSREGLHVVLISPHGLIRGRDLELGRDADTGGQTLYVVELARALVRDARVRRVELFTRRIVDPKIDPSYAEPEEDLAPGARIVRLDFGPRRYLRKESLWPHLDLFADRILAHFRRTREVPDVVHSHYADAGLVGSTLESLLGAPLVHTGHSLGRSKKASLLERGVAAEEIEERFRIARRIEAEEVALDHAALVVASTRQEVEEQYAAYENYDPGRMAVIPPGTDLSRFHPPDPDRPEAAVAAVLDRFLADPDKPLVLALARPDPRKNLGALVEAFGRSERLRDAANLALVAGTRDDIREMKREPRRELTSLLLAIDRFDLHGAVAFPKHHRPEEVPELYRLAARRRGVFVNPALTEPFGLTLIEAAASGLPVVATDDGGPRDILDACGHGVLVDATDVEALERAIFDSLTDRDAWEERARRGPEGARRHFRWESHVERYLDRVGALVTPERRRASRPSLAARERVLVSDIDGTLLGDDAALDRLATRLEEGSWGFGVATGRRLESARTALEEAGAPTPDLWITSVGAEIHYGPQLARDRNWERHLDYRWDREGLLRRIQELLGGRGVLQDELEQGPHKLSFDLEDAVTLHLPRLRRQLREVGLHANLVYSHGSYLDVLPIRCSKGNALRWVAQRWGIALDAIVVAGDSGNDRDLLTGATPAIVVGNHAPEIADLADQPRIYFARAAHAAGILEGLDALDPERSEFVVAEKPS